MRRIAILFLVILIFSISSNVSVAWWDTSWNYRTPITIRAQENVDNIQARIVRNFSQEYSEGKIDNYCKDLRFTYYNGTSGTETEIPYWIEDCNISSGRNVSVWIKIPSLSTSDSTVYMYYGNPTASSNSSGERTFILYDDFNGTSVNTTKWIISKSSGGSYVGVENGYLREYVYDTTYYKRWAVITTSQSFEYPLIVFARISHINMGAWWCKIGTSSETNPTFDNKGILSMRGPSTGSFNSKDSVVMIGSDTLAYSELNHPDNSWYIVEVGATNTTTWSDNNYGTRYSINGSISYSSGHIMLGIYKWSSYTPTVEYHVDWVAARKYIDQDPTYTFGPEESSVVHWIKTYDSNGKLRSYFGKGENITIIANITDYSGSPVIKIKNSTGDVIEEANMTNVTPIENYVGLWEYNFTSSDQGWYTASISFMNYNGLFFVGDVWNDEWTDSDGVMFPFRVSINVSETGISDRIFEPVDLNINFKYLANNKSIRLVMFNGTKYIEIPVQLYNFSYVGGDIQSANVIFLSTVGKGENKTYYIYYTKPELQEKNYGTDIIYSNSSNVFSVENSKYRVVIDGNRGGTLKEAYDIFGSNSNIGGFNPMQFSPEVKSGPYIFRASDLSNPNITVVNGNIMTILRFRGEVGTVKFDTTYKIISHSPYIILELNVTPKASESWDYYYDNEYYFKDGIFEKFNWRNSSGVFEYSIGEGNGNDIQNLGNVNWISLYNIHTRNSFSTIFLNDSQSRSFIPNVGVFDESTYEYYKRTKYSGAVTPSDYFYSKSALDIWNSVDGYSELNQTYFILNNPVGVSVGGSETSDTEPPSYSTIGNVSTDDAHDAVCYSYWSDNTYLDHAKINITGPGINGTNSMLYFNDSYRIRDSQGKFVNESWVNITVPESVLEAGNIHCNITVYDIAGLSNSSSTSFFVSDATPPKLSSTETDPGTEAGLDPNVTINITANITEYTDVSTVILQYRELNSSWINKTMVKIWNDTYKYSYLANFTPTKEDIYQYRIFMNDTLGNYNYSDIYNLSVFWDWTWSVSPDSLGTVSGPLDTNVSFPNITIRNTGDKSLYFRLSSNWPNKDNLYFDGIPESSGYSFSLSPGDERNISINVTTLSAEREDGIIIDIDSVNSSASPSYYDINGTVISFSGGPYLYTKITYYNSSIMQGQNMEINISVQNKGNETATSSWLYVDIPNDWEIAEDRNKTLGNVSVDEVKYITAIVHVKDSASTGTKTVTVLSGCAEKNRTWSDSKEIVVIPKPQTEIISAGGGGGGGPAPGISAEAKAKLFQTEEVYEIVRGRDKKFILTVENPFFGSNLENVTIEISGYLSKYLKVKPVYPVNIPMNQSRNFTIEIIAPKYFSKGEYNLTFKINAIINETGVLTYLTELRNIKLIVHEVSREDALEALNKTREMIDNLTLMNTSTRKLSEQWVKAYRYFNMTDYESSKKLTDSIASSYYTAIDAYNMLLDLENKLKDAHMKYIKTPKTTRLVNLAKAAFKRGSFDLAKERLDEALLTYAYEIKGEFSVRYFVEKNWLNIIIGSIIASIIGFLLYIRFSIMRINSKLKMLSKEEDIILGLIKEIQKECFEDKKMSIKEYREALAQYESKLNRIVEKMIELETIRSHLMRFQLRKEKMLRAEKRRLIGLIKKTQRDYLERGIIETRMYENKMKSYTSRLSEIEEQLTLQEAHKALGKVKLPWSIIKRITFISIIVLILVVSMQFAFALSVEAKQARDALQSAEKDIMEMNNTGFSIQRVTDLYTEAKQIYDAQLLMEEKTGKGNFEGVLERVQKIKDVKEKAFEALDELNALETYIKDAEEDIPANYTPVWNLYNQAKKEIEDERYENALEIIDKAYAKLTDVQAVSTRLKAVYEAGIGRVKLFLYNNWKLILAFASILIILYILLRKRIRLYILKETIKKLELEKKILYKLVTKTQEEYFDKKTISESVYFVRTKKFAEMIRDINRQIPLLKEEIEKLNKGIF